MNITKAKEQVKNALRAYLTKDEFGDYVLPLESQRPVFLMGPPGIGKTAIMSQIAHELGIGLVSYSMTHHTRQSALGLPYITDKEFAGESYRVSHYTMSEIIAVVHELIEATGLQEGILFLDEVNCVSETLAPAMLQFLQFKTFGQHKVPEGWIIVTAGNPPEYNNSVREFDIVTWDRLKRIDIEPDYEAWRQYARSIGVHPAVTTYLELKKQHFYKVESTVEGRRFVTARGWVDLSRMMQLYEANEIEADGDLVVQYLQDPEIAHDFASYYQLFSKYKADYRISEILAGKTSEQILDRAAKAPFDERLSLVGMLLDACLQQVNEAVDVEDHINDVLDRLRRMRDAKASTPVTELVEAEIQQLNKKLQRSDRSSLPARRKHRVLERALQFFENAAEHIAASDNDPYEVLKGLYAQRLTAFKEQVASTKIALDNAFIFFEQAFQEGQEMLIFVTDLTANEAAAGFISHYGCDKYFEHNKELLFYERQKEIIQELKDLDL